MSINNREEANKYYNQINKLVDEYTETHKIRPSRLGKYLKPGSDRSKKFLKRNNLDMIDGSDRILNDIIEDRVNMEEDGILTFENYKYFESSDFKIDSLKQSLYKGIEKSDLNSEKALADYFDVNLGSIDVIDSDKHKFKLEDWKNDDWLVVVYSKEDLELIKSNMIENLYDEISEKDIELADDLKINLSKLINKESFEEKLEEILSESKLNKLISSCLGEEWSFEGKVRDFYIWVS